eukprot:6182000-Pleurochrysis_carterae.AAC.2
MRLRWYRAASRCGAAARRRSNGGQGHADSPPPDSARSGAGGRHERVRTCNTRLSASSTRA